METKKKIVENIVLDEERALYGSEREIVTLHISGFRHREIAEIMEKPIGTVLWTYNNALAKLKRALQKEGEDEV